MNNTYSVYLHIFPNGKVYVGITKFKPEYRWNNGNLIDVYGSLRKADENGYNRNTCRNKINNTDFLEFGGFLWKILD